MILLHFIAAATAYILASIVGVIYHANMLIGPAGITCLVLGLCLWARIQGE